MGPDLNGSLSQLRRRMARESLEVFAKLYLPQHVSRAPSPAHLDVYRQLEIITSARGQSLAVAAPRGFGKTTMITTVYVLYSVCFATEAFIILLSDSLGQTVQILDAIRKELESNTRLLADFPELSGARPSPWKRDEIVTPNRVKLLALGSRQNIRGRKHGASRPTLVIADDLERAENAYSEESRSKLRDWLNRSVYKAGTQETNYCFLGTLHHPFCLLAEYVSEAHPQWIKRVYNAILQWSTREDLWEQWSRIYAGRELYEEAGGPMAARRYFEANQSAMLAGTQVLWPERWSYYELMVERQKDPWSFNSELQNEPVNERDCVFPVEEFTYCSDVYRSVDELLLALQSHLDFYAGCDPALGKDFMRGDYGAIIVLARDRRDGSLYILFADIARRSPTQLIQDLLAFEQRFRFTKIAVETNQFQELLAQELERLGREQGLYPRIERVINDTDKVRRIQGLHSLMKNGTIKFNRAHHLLLEQARFFPRGKHDDGLDALEMAVRVASQHYDGPFLHVIRINPGGIDEDDEDGDARWINLD